MLSTVPTPPLALDAPNHGQHAQRQRQPQHIHHRGGHQHLHHLAPVFDQVGPEPAPAEVLVLGVVLLLEGEQFGEATLMGGKFTAGHPQGPQFGLEQAGLPVGVHPIEQADAAALHQGGRGGHPRQSVGGHPRRAPPAGRGCP